MDKRTQEDRDLLEAAAQPLRSRGVLVEPSWPATLPPPGREGPRLRLTYAGHELEYATTIWRRVGRENLGALVELSRSRALPTLLVTDYVTPPLAEKLREADQQFIDAAGNAYLERAPLVIWIAGRKRTAGARAIRPSAGRAFQSAGLRVVFALLCHPEWISLPYRDLARRTDVAHGSVGEVLAELREQGFVADIEGQRKLLQRAALQLRWAEAYPRVLRRKLWLGRYRAADLRRLGDPALVPSGFSIGGEVAAARLVTNLQPGSAVVYGSTPTAEMLKSWRLSPDPEGNVEFRRKFWEFADAGGGFAPAALVHADLLSSGDQRCLEAAREIHERLEAGSV